jgi:hypothetical protein
LRHTVKVNNPLILVLSCDAGRAGFHEDARGLMNKIFNQSLEGAKIAKANTRDIPQWLRKSFDFRAKNDMLHGTVSRRVLMETYEPRILLSADFMPIAGAISAPGEQDTYAITVAEPSRVTFDALTESQLRWKLEGPDGSSISSRFNTSDGSPRSQAPSFDMVRGTYTLTVDGLDGQTGDYSFQLRDLDEAQAISEGETVSGSLATGRETAIYNFDAQAGETLFIDVENGLSSSVANWTVLDPTGQQLGSVTSLSDRTQVLNSDGTYTLLAEGRLGNDAALDFSFSISLSDKETFDYTPGETANGAIESVGDVHIHRFNVAADGRYAFSGNATNFHHDWVIRGREGTLISGSFLPSEDTPSTIDLKAGDYWVVFTGRNTLTSPYSFKLERTSEPYAGSNALQKIEAASLDTVFSGSLSETGAYDRYDFTLAELTDVRLDVLSENFNLAVRLEGPDGRVFNLTSFYAAASQDYKATLAAGEYSIVVSANNGTAGDYRFKLSDASQTTPVDLSAPLQAVLDEDDALKSWSFDLQAGDRLFLDVTAAAFSSGSLGSTYWRLYGPDGSNVFSAFPYEGAPDQFIVKQDGIYRLELQRRSFVVMTHFEADVFVANVPEVPMVPGDCTHGGSGQYW